MLPKGHEGERISRLQSLKTVEKQTILKHLEHHGFNVRMASKTLGVTVNTIYNRADRYHWDLKVMREAQVLSKLAGRGEGRGPYDIS